jgi:hypothetical protein
LLHGDSAVPIVANHEIDELANGNLLVMGTELREHDNWYTSETDPDAPRSRQKVMGDVVIEFTRAGEVVWEWKALDHLDPYRIGYETFTNYWIRRGFPGARDWSHGNEFFHNEKDDSLLISFRMQDAVVKVDRKTGEIVWILGNHTGWPPRLQQKLLTPEGDMPWFYHQHMPQISPRGTLILFDNRTWSASPFAPPLLRLDPATGKMLSETVLDDRDPETGDNLQVQVRGLDMPVALPDVLSSDGGSVFMRSQRFGLKGMRQASTAEKRHLFCPLGSWMTPGCTDRTGSTATHSGPAPAAIPAPDDRTQPEGRWCSTTRGSMVTAASRITSAG